MSRTIYVAGLPGQAVAALQDADIEVHVVDEPPIVIQFEAIPRYDVLLEPPCKPHPKSQPQPKRPRK